MANYGALKTSVAKNGEVMVRLDTGEKIELHIHNTRFEDSIKETVVEAAIGTYWIAADRLSYYWIHKEGFGKEYVIFLHIEIKNNRGNNSTGLILIVIYSIL